MAEKTLQMYERRVPDSVESDLDYIETGDDPLIDRARMARLLYQEVFETGSKRPDKKKKFPVSGSSLRHFYLPGNYGDAFNGDSDPNTMREGYDSRHEIWQIENRNFMTADQGGLWVAPKASNPYFYTSMSECSCIVGVGNENLIVSHIAFSEVQEIEATLKFLYDNGVSEGNRYVIASVGSYQQQAGSRMYTKPRLTRIEDYEALGFPEKNITAFNHRPGPAEGQSWTLNSICKLVLNRNFIYNYTGDYKQTTTHGNGIRSKLEGDYTNEHVFDISNLVKS